MLPRFLEARKPINYRWISPCKTMSVWSLWSNGTHGKKRRLKINHVWKRGHEDGGSPWKPGINRRLIGQAAGAAIRWYTRSNVQRSCVALLWGHSIAAHLTASGKSLVKVQYIVAPTPRFTGSVLLYGSIENKSELNPELRQAGRLFEHPAIIFSWKDVSGRGAKCEILPSGVSAEDFEGHLRHINVKRMVK